MARPKEFDREVALERALDLFWEKGFEATSVADLVEVTGVQRQSLYDTFGDKDRLFHAALDLYTSRIAALIRTLDNDDGKSPLAKIRTLFRVTAADAGPGNRGCMLVNSAVERGMHDDAVIEHARTGVAFFEKTLMRAIGAAQVAGEVPRGISPKIAARLLIAVFWGLRAMGRSVPDPAWQRSVVDGALGLLTK